jgi:hypothetical protein
MVGRFRQYPIGSENTRVTSIIPEPGFLTESEGKRQIPMIFVSDPIIVLNDLGTSVSILQSTYTSTTTGYFISARFGYPELSTFCISKM